MMHSHQRSPLIDYSESQRDKTKREDREQRRAIVWAVARGFLMLGVLVAAAWVLGVPV